MDKFGSRPQDLLYFFKDNLKKRSLCTVINAVFFFLRERHLPSDSEDAD